VTVTVTSSVAAELIASAEIGPGDAFCWRLPDGSQTADPRAALTDALVAIANGSGGPTAAGGQEPAGHTSERPAIRGDVTLTLPASIAVGLLEHAGLEHSDHGTGWRNRNGHEDSDPAVALTDALVAIAEDDLAAELTRQTRKTK
jgi:hypothetical protein